MHREDGGRDIDQAKRRRSKGDFLGFIRIALDREMPLLDCLSAELELSADDGEEYPRGTVAFLYLRGKHLYVESASFGVPVEDCIV